MKFPAIGFAVLALAAGPLSAPSATQASTINCRGIGRDVRWYDRFDLSEARFAINTQDGDVTLLLTDRDVAFQLSDRAMRKVNRELKNAKDDQDNVLASVVVAVVTGTVREMLDHSMVCHVRDLQDVRYEDGRLIFIGKHGRAVFCGEDDCDPNGVRAFSERDAQAFVKEFRRVKAGR